MVPPRREHGSLAVDLSTMTAARRSAAQAHTTGISRGRETACASLAGAEVPGTVLPSDVSRVSGVRSVWTLCVLDLGPRSRVATRVAGLLGYPLGVGPRQALPVQRIGSERLESAAWMRDSGLENSRHVQVLHRANQKTASLDAIDGLSKAPESPGSTSPAMSSSASSTST